MQCPTFQPPRAPQPMHLDTTSTSGLQRAFTCLVLLHGVCDVAILVLPQPYTALQNLRGPTVFALCPQMYRKQAYRLALCPQMHRKQARPDAATTSPYSIAQRPAHALLRAASLARSYAAGPALATTLTVLAPPAPLAPLLPSPCPVPTPRTTTPVNRALATTYSSSPST